MNENQPLPSPSMPPPSPAPSAERSQSKDTIADNLHRSSAADDAKAVGVATPAARPETQEAQTKPGLLGATKEVFSKFSDDDVMTQAAALAFYTGIAMAPLLTVIVWAAQLVLGDDTKREITKTAQSILGSAASGPITQLLDPASEQAKGGMTLTGILSIVFLAFTASSVLAQLQSSLNLIWRVKADPKKSGIVLMIRKRLFSFGMLFTLLFLLLVSMLVTVAILAVVSRLFGSEATFWAEVGNAVASLVVATGVFMLLFTYLPDARVPWRDTLFGAALTAVLFVIGRYGLGFYLSKSDYGTSYGAVTGSFVALLVWVYYTSIIIFIGTEATTVWARRRGHDPVPEPHAVRTLRTERVIERPEAAPRLAGA